MSGTPILMQPLPPPVTEFAYASVVQALGLQDLPASERVQALFSLPIADILAKMPPSCLPLMPAVDGDLIPAASSFAQAQNRDHDPASQLPGKSWCEALMVGDCANDASIIGLMLGPRKTGIAQSFTASITKTFAATPAHATALFDAYGISAAQADEEALPKILAFAGDIGFYAPAVALAQGWPGAAYLYHFNEPNPWEGPAKGQASHILDVAYLLQNFNEFLTAEHQAVAERFGGDVVAFVNGEKPWDGFKEREGARVYGQSGGRGAEAEWAAYEGGMPGKATGRSGKIWELGEKIGLDVLSQAWGTFSRGA
jgi:carboxylesterase type B